MPTSKLSCLLAGAGLLLALAARAQNPVVPGQSPLRRLSPAAGQPGQPATPGLDAPLGTGHGSLDSLRTLSGSYKRLESDEKTLVLFDVTVGFAHPLGSFADAPAGGGGATNGGTLAVEAAYLFTPYLGVFGSLGGGVQPVRDEAIAATLKLTPQNATAVSYGKAGWSHVTVAGGPQLTLPLGRPGGLALDLRPGVGLTYAISPRYGATFTDAGGQVQHQFVSSAGAFAVSYQAGAALRVPLGERLGLRLGADYFYTRPAFDDYSPNTTLIVQDSHTSHTLSFGQLSLGLVVRFE